MSTILPYALSMSDLSTLERIAYRQFQKIAGVSGPTATDGYDGNKTGPKKRRGRHVPNNPTDLGELAAEAAQLAGLLLSGSPELFEAANDPFHRLSIASKVAVYRVASRHFISGSSVLASKGLKLSGSPVPRQAACDMLSAEVYDRFTAVLGDMVNAMSDPVLSAVFASSADPAVLWTKGRVEADTRDAILTAVNGQLESPVSWKTVQRKSEALATLASELASDVLARVV